MGKSKIAAKLDIDAYLKTLALGTIKTLGKTALAEVQKERDDVKKNVSTIATDWDRSVGQIIGGLNQVLIGQFSNHVKQSAQQKRRAIQELQDTKEGFVCTTLISDNSRPSKAGFYMDRLLGFHIGLKVIK